MKLTLNHASRRYLNRRALNQIYLVLSLLLCALLAYQVVNSLQGKSRAEQFQKNISELQQQLGQLQGEAPRHLTADRIEKQKVEFAQVETILDRDAFRWSALFDRMELLLPDGASIRSFNPNYKDKSLVLNGVVKGLSDLQQLLDNLLADSFQQVYLQNQGMVEVSDGSGGKAPALNFSLKIEGVF